MISEKLEAEGRNQSNFELLLFFKRLINLILLGVKPVIVFDGKAPDLKRRSLM